MLAVTDEEGTPTVAWFGTDVVPRKEIEAGEKPRIGHIGMVE